MRELVGMLPDREFYCAEVLGALATSEDNWDAAHRFCFAAGLAMEGDPVAKQAMYASYRPGPKTADLLGLYFVMLDGLSGFLFAAERIGGLFAAGLNDLDIGWLVSETMERCGERETWDALRDGAVRSAEIEAFKVAAEEDRARHRPPRGKGNRDGRKEELEQLAAQGPEFLLPLIDSKDRRIAVKVFQALAMVRHPAVRALAFDLVNHGSTWRRRSIQLLSANFEAGDHTIALGWFEKEEGSDALHGFQGDLLDFWQEHPEQGTEVAMLLRVYEKGPCSFCRKRTVRRLIELGELPEPLRAECACDANEDIRELVA
jgi:hypothetical protein